MIVCDQDRCIIIFIPLKSNPAIPRLYVAFYYPEGWISMVIRNVSRHEHLIPKYVTHFLCLMLSQYLEVIHLSIQYCELSVKLHHVTTKHIFKSIWYSWIQVAKITSYCMEFSCYLETGDYVMLQHSNTFNSRDILKRWPIMMPCSVWRRSHHRNLDWSWSNI